MVIQILALKKTKTLSQYVWFLLRGINFLLSRKICHDTSGWVVSMSWETGKLYV